MQPPYQGQMRLPGSVPVGSITLECLIDGDARLHAVCVRSDTPDGTLISMWSWPLPENPERAFDQALDELRTLWQEVINPF